MADLRGCYAIGPRVAHFSLKQRPCIDDLIITAPPPIGAPLSELHRASPTRALGLVEGRGSVGLEALELLLRARGNDEITRRLALIRHPTLPGIKAATKDHSPAPSWMLSSRAGGRVENACSVC